MSAILRERPESVWSCNPHAQVLVHSTADGEGWRDANTLKISRIVFHLYTMNKKITKPVTMWLDDKT